MKAKCSNCKYGQRYNLPGRPYDHRWRCTRSDAKKIQCDAGYLIDPNNMPCFEPKRVAFWRLPVCIVLGIFTAITSSIIAWFIISGVVWSLFGVLLDRHTETSGKVAIALGTVAVVLGIVAGVLIANKWRKGDG